MYELNINDETVKIEQDATVLRNCKKQQLYRIKNILEVHEYTQFECVNVKNTQDWFFLTVDELRSKIINQNWTVVEV
jgi:hypothetical protein